MGEHTCDHGEDGLDKLEEIADKLGTSFNNKEKQLIYNAAYYFRSDLDFRNGVMDDDKAAKYVSLNDLISEYDAKRHAFNIDCKNHGVDAFKNRSNYWEGHAIRTYIHLIEHPVIDPSLRYKHIEAFIKRGGPLPGLSVEKIHLYHQALLLHFGLDGARQKFQLLSSDVANYMVQGDFNTATIQRGILCDWIDYTRKDNNIPVITTTELSALLIDLKGLAIEKLLSSAVTFKNDAVKRDECIKQALKIPKFDIFDGMREFDPEIKQKEDYSWVEDKALDIANKK